MGELLIILLPFLILWGLSLNWLFSWKRFWFFFAANAVATFLYLFYLINSRLEYIGHDEYGLRRGGLILLILTFHVLSIFLFAMIRKIKTRKKND